MSEGGYKIRNKEGVYFVTFAVVGWVDVFARKEYCHIVVDSIKYCQQEKGLILYSWCLMSNHVHMAISGKDNNLSDILRDFKKYTSKELIKTIGNNVGESRKEWMLKIFEEAGTENIRNKNYQFWQQDNQPKELFSESFTRQKLEYIHNNPVEAGIVEKAEEYRYSSARDYYYGKPCGLIKVDYLL
jgi:REP element-mobilizing transposase RayT